MMQNDNVEVVIGSWTNDMFSIILPWSSDVHELRKILSNRFGVPTGMIKLGGGGTFAYRLPYLICGFPLQHYQEHGVIDPCHSIERLSQGDVFDIISNIQIDNFSKISNINMPILGCCPKDPNFEEYFRKPKNIQMIEFEPTSIIVKFKCMSAKRALDFQASLFYDIEDISQRKFLIDKVCFSALNGDLMNMVFGYLDHSSLLEMARVKIKLHTFQLTFTDTTSEEENDEFSWPLPYDEFSLKVEFDSILENGKYRLNIFYLKSNLTPVNIYFIVQN